MFGLLELLTGGCHDDIAQLGTFPLGASNVASNPVWMGRERQQTTLTSLFSASER